MYKIVNINFLLYLKFYQNFKNYHAGKLNKTYLVNIYFASPSRTVFWDLSFYFCVKVHKLNDSFIYLEKVSIPYFSTFLCHILSLGSSGLNCQFIRREYGFSINSKILFMSSGDKPVLTLKILVTNFCRF